MPLSGTVAALLEPAQEQLADEVADVEGISRRIEADVQTDRPLLESRSEGVAIRRIVGQPTCVEFVEQVHRASMLPADVHRSDSNWAGAVSGSAPLVI